jgi:transketolase
VGVGAGLASCGKKVFVCGPACFYVARSLEQLKVDVAYSQLPVKILGVSGGVSYGALGFTHHSLHDIAVLRTFPGMYVVLPCDIFQTQLLVQQLIDFPHPVYVRVGRNAVPNVYNGSGSIDFAIGRANLLAEGNDLALVGTGETTWHCQQAASALHKHGIMARVIDMHTVKPLDTEILLSAAAETGRIITVEEHSCYGGLGAAVAELVAQSGHQVRMKIIGIPDEFAVHGTAQEIFRHYGLDAGGIEQAALALLNASPRKR